MDKEKEIPEAATVLTDERIVQLIDQHTDRHFGLIVDPFARAIEREVLAQAGVRAEPAANVRTMPDMLTVETIQGAIAFGRMGINPPPSPDHWGNEFWQIGRQLAKLGETSAWNNVTPVDVVAQVPTAEVRAQALEEAAQIAETCYAKSAVSFELGTEAAKRIRSLAQSITADKASEVRAAEWISVEDRLPGVPEDDSREVIIACRRAHNGKTYVFAAEYLNAKLLQTDSDDYPEEGKPFTGWYQERDDSSGEYDTAWHPVCQVGDVVTHWMPLPAAPSTADSSNTETGGA